MSSSTEGVQYRNWSSAQGKKWAQPVHCPGCGQPAEHRQNKPRYRCRDPRCLFRHGWRLCFGDEIGRVQDRLYAVPVGMYLALMPEHSVPWPDDEMFAPVPKSPSISHEENKT